MRQIAESQVADKTHCRTVLDYYIGLPNVRNADLMYDQTVFFPETTTLYKRPIVPVSTEACSCRD
jgi:hypothetical protein